MSVESDSGLEKPLESGILQMGLKIDQAKVETLLTYIRLLVKWNKVYNLTAIQGESKMISHHLLDSFAVLPALHGEFIVDVGAGAGLPGIPLAIMRPDIHFVELESSQKKSRFMQQALVELGIKNVTVACQRAEKYHDQVFDTVLSRAFASLQEMLHVAGHLCDQQGIILAMKGKIPKTELNSLPEGFFCEQVEQLAVPGLEAERHLVHIKPKFIS